MSGGQFDLMSVPLPQCGGQFDPVTSVCDVFLLCYVFITSETK